MARGWKVWTALWIVYLVWGSTYFAIKISVRTLPPLLSAGARFMVAGLILAAIVTLQGRSLRVPWREARAAAALGIALLGTGVGVVTLAETRIDSSIAAMIAGSVPLQVIIWRTIARQHIALATRLGAIVGLAGLALIVVPTGVGGGATAIGLAMMLGATMSWSLGSFFSTRVTLPRDGFVATVYEMLAGGFVLVIVSLIAGEGGDLAAATLSAASIAAWAYLVTAGSLVAFTAYAWLLQNAPISQVVTHQYVNPLVAIGLGSVFLGESLSATTIVGAAIVIGAVFVTIRSESRRIAVPVTAPTAPESETCASALR